MWLSCEGCITIPVFINVNYNAWYSICAPYYTKWEI